MFTVTSGLILEEEARGGEEGVESRTVKEKTSLHPLRLRSLAFYNLMTVFLILDQRGERNSRDSRCCGMYCCCLGNVS